MPITETVRDAPPRNIAPVDESVLVPASVRRASAAADAAYAAAYATPQPDPAVVVPPAQADGGTVLETPPVVPPVVPPVAAPVVADPPVTSDGGDNDTTWHHRFLSMQGRYNAGQRLIADMQEQMTQLGDELMRSQQVIRRPMQGTPAAPVVTTPPATNLLTPQDQETYGPELIEFTQRAAKAAIQPELTALQQENQSLKKKVQGGDMRVALGQLSQSVPNWRAVNVMPEWNNWLRQRDVYSGRLRHQLLNEANAAADAPRMIAFFKNFLAEQEATGQPVTTSQPVPPVVPPVPRQAAIPLVTLAAPGRAKPASGDTPASADKPILTRGQVAEFYRRVRAGHYANDPAEKAKDEAIIFAAQRDNRIR